MINQFLSEIKRKIPLNLKREYLSFKSPEIFSLFNQVWNIDVILFHEQTIILNSNNITFYLDNDKLVVINNNKKNIETNKLNFDDGQLVNISFSLKEGIIRILGTNRTDGTWKSEPIKFEENQISFLRIKSNGEKTKLVSINLGGKFFSKNEVLKNISGLKAWYCKDSGVELFPDTNKISTWKDKSCNLNDLNQTDINLAPSYSENKNIFFNSGEFIETNYIDNLLKNKELTIFIFFELYEYVSKQEKHEIFKISDKNNKNELSLFTEYQNEEIGKFPKYEKKTSIFLNNELNFDGEKHTVQHLLDVFFSSNEYGLKINNETPGPDTPLVIFNKIKDNTILLKNFFYKNSKWFSLNNLNIDNNKEIKFTENKITIGSNSNGFHGSIKEMFIFDKLLFSEENPEQEKWLFQYLESKYNFKKDKFTLLK
jgi:hypothetical protein